MKHQLDEETQGPRRMGLKLWNNDKNTENVTLVTEINRTIKYSSFPDKLRGPWKYTNWEDLDKTEREKQSNTIVIKGQEDRT